VTTSSKCREYTRVLGKCKVQANAVFAILPLTPVCRFIAPGAQVELGYLYLTEPFL
jgi:hypothetical protein